MTSPHSAGADDATATLLAFASGSGEEIPLRFSGADVSAASLGDKVHNAPWWDHSHHGLKLQKRRMSGADISHANLSHADLDGADLSSARGAGVVLRHARLEGTNLNGADLVGADLSWVDAGEADFTEALLEDAKLQAAKLRFANLSGAIMDGADLSDTDLWGARLGKIAAERAVFRNARLDESSGIGAELASADFSGATLRRTNLSQAVLRNANFRDATLDNADLSSADLQGAHLPNVSLASCRLAKARFAGAWLERTRLRASQIGNRVGEEIAGDLEAAIDSYIVLERNFISLGISGDASWAYRRRRRVGRALHAKNTREAWKAKRTGAALAEGTRWLGDVAAEWLCDYGESLGRVARAFFTVLIGFAVLYWLTGSLAVRPGYTSTGIYSLLNYLLFSLDSMTTVGTSEVALRPAGELGVLLSSMETVLGTTLIGLFGFVLGARIRN